MSASCWPDVQVALVITTAACVGALLLGCVVRGRDYTKEAVCLLSSAAAGMTMIAVTKVVWGVVTGLVVWLGLRVHLRKRAEVSWGFPEIILYVLFPSLVVGLVRRAWTFAGAEAWVSVGLAGSVVIVFAWAVFLFRRDLRPKWGMTLSWLPVGATFALVSVSFARGGYIESGFPISDPGKPHVVLIVLDTVRADHLSAYGLFEGHHARARPMVPAERVVGSASCFSGRLDRSRPCLHLLGEDCLSAWYPLRPRFGVPDSGIRWNRLVARDHVEKGLSKLCDHR